MFSVNFPKESIYYEIKKNLQKNAKENQPNSIIINYTNNSPINFTKINTINNYQTVNSEKNSNKYKSKIAITKNYKRIKDNSNKNKLSIETSNIENNRYHIKNLSPLITLNENMNTKTLSDKMDYKSFYYKDNNSILKQKILNKLNEQKKQKLNTPKNIKKSNYYIANKKNILLKTVQNNSLRKSPFYIQLKRDFNKNNNNYSLNFEDVEKIRNKNNKLYTEKRSKYYNFFESSKSNELFRNFEDLEKKSIEISKRKMIKNNLDGPFFSVKKDNNLNEIKQSLDNIRTKLFYKEEKNKIKNELNSRNKYINKTINKQNSIKALYHISKIKTKINKNKIDNQNDSFKRIKKIFIIKSNNKRKTNQSPYVKKNYIEDNNPLNTLATSINNHIHKDYFYTKNKDKKIQKNILPSISEETDRIKMNLVYTLKKIIAKRKMELISDFLRKIEKENKKNKNLNIVYNSAKKSSKFKYSKKIITINMNKNKKLVDIKNNNNIKLSNEKASKNKFSIFKDFGKVKKLINNLRINLIGFSLKKNYHS